MSKASSAALEPAIVVPAELIYANVLESQAHDQNMLAVVRRTQHLVAVHVVISTVAITAPHPHPGIIIVVLRIGAGVAV